MIKLVQTCGACPEQYDAFDEHGSMVGYLRLRHGTFRVECPDVGGVEVYHANPRGDGVFEYEERDYYLRWAVFKIQEWIEAGRPSSMEPILPAAPEVEFTVENKDWDDWK